MIKQIRRVSIIGMGALGIMYGYFLSKSLKDIDLTFVADRKRQEQYAKEGIFFNDKLGEEGTHHIMTGGLSDGS